jgi:4-hydroxythreonine-4-phosphate dehydrogenase
MGDPSGVGPEVTIKALSDKQVQRLGHITVVGDYFVINKLKKYLKLSSEFSLIDLSNVPQNSFSYGRSSPSFGKASVEYIDKALDMLNKGEADCMVTAPVNKSAVREGGLKNFEGHTEYIAQKMQVKDFSMMFVGKLLKISLVTRHLALKDVAGYINKDLVYKTIMLTADSLKRNFGIDEPKIGVSGLNPHAGDNGLFGDEEFSAICPAIKKASLDIKNLCGPIPADAIFYKALNGKFDAIVSMYHDQALAPFKMLYFKDGVNLTLGLPFVRTSPGHGTAFDIAGTGAADATSMKEAIRLAAALSKKR